MGKGRKGIRGVAWGRGLEVWTGGGVRGLGAWPGAWTGGVAFWALPGCKDLGCGLEAWSEGVDWGNGLG